jgi:hypothetical protein
MIKKFKTQTLAAIVCVPMLIVTLGVAASAQDMPAEYQQVLTTLGKKGDYKAGVFKLNIPRGDLHVTIEGKPVPTSFGFGGWLAMTKGNKGEDVMMGDLVLQQEEVNPVMSALLTNGLEVTALHNHFFFEQPRIFFMHVHGMGKPVDLARMVKPAVSLIDGFMTGKSGSSPAPTAPELDTAKLDQIVGQTGEKLAGGTYKYTIGRSDLKLKEMGAAINARMGLNTWAAFYGSNEDSVIAGDVAMLEHELNSVLKSLRSHGLEVVAIHHHMTGSRPMIIFLHYWGKGSADSLAAGFKAALDQLGKKPAGSMGGH